MLKTFRTTAVISIIAAVFFIILNAENIGAADSSLTILGKRLNNLIFQTSRSIVTLESIRTPQTPASVGEKETLQSLVSSGVVFDNNGGILVAASSVLRYDKLLVHFNNLVIPARLVGIDYLTGLALINVGRPLGNPVQVSRQHGCAGQMVLALGNAYGVRASPTLGFCAGMRPDGSIQFSGPISSGTVGGGLFNLSGKLVGLITSEIGHGRWAEVGIAVPSLELAKTFRYLSEHGDRQAGYIGITSTDIDISPNIEVALSAQFAESKSQRSFIVSKAVMVTGVVPLSPAANAGFAKGDLLISLNGESITSAEALQTSVRQYRPGTVINIGFIRNNTPYVSPLQIGRLRQATFDTFQGMDKLQSFQHKSPNSLQKEIDKLKKSLRALEKRLHNLH